MREIRVVPSLVAPQFASAGLTSMQSRPRIVVSDATETAGIPHRAGRSDRALAVQPPFAASDGLFGKLNEPFRDVNRLPVDIRIVKWRSWLRRRRAGSCRLSLTPFVR